MQPVRVWSLLITMAIHMKNTIATKEFTKKIMARISKQNVQFSKCIDKTFFLYMKRTQMGFSLAGISQKMSALLYNFGLEEEAKFLF